MMTNAAATEPIDLQTALDRLSSRAIPVRTTSPDLLGQLRAAQQSPIKRLVCIGVDLDAQCDLLAETCRTRADAIARGLALLSAWTGAAPLRIDAPSADTAYPNLRPPLLVRRLTRQRLAPGQLPTAAGVLVVDVLTAAMLGDMFSGEAHAEISPRHGVSHGPPHWPPHGPPLPVIIDDHILRTRYRTTASADAPVAAVLIEAGMPMRHVQLRHGPLVASAAIDPTTPLGQTDLWLHVLPALPDVAAACTRCGECVAACPAGIHPAALLEAGQRADAVMARRFHAQACVDCGLCTAVCPSSLPVMAGVVAARALLHGRTA